MLLGLIAAFNHVILTVINPEQTAQCLLNLSICYPYYHSVVGACALHIHVTGARWRDDGRLCYSPQFLPLTTRRQSLWEPGRFEEKRGTWYNGISRDWHVRYTATFDTSTKGDYLLLLHVFKRAGRRASRSWVDWITSSNKKHTTNT